MQSYVNMRVVFRGTASEASLKRKRNRRFYAIPLIAIISTAAAQGNEPPLPPGFTLPVALNSHAVTANDYPATSIRLGEQGFAIVGYTINKDGNVTGNCALLKSSGKTRIDEAACTLTHKWKFQPATRDGEPIPVNVVAGVAFGLTDLGRSTGLPSGEELDRAVAAAGFQYGLQAAQAGDYLNALVTFASLAKDGHAGAQGALGILYGEGRGVPQNPEEAVKWFRLGAGQGDAGSQTSLGLAYFAGKGVATNPVKALMWFTVAAPKAGPNSPAAQNRDRLRQIMAESQSREAEELAQRCTNSNFKDCE
jgi:TonB family protein